MQYILIIILLIATLIFIFGTRRAMRMSQISVALIEKYENDKENPELIQEIFGLLFPLFPTGRGEKAGQTPKISIKSRDSCIRRWNIF